MLLPRLSAFTLLAHGDFSSTIGTLRDAPLAVAELPHRKIYFVTDPALVSTATLGSAATLRDRQDAAASGGGIVQSCGDEWTRRRERLRVLQSRDGLEALAVPAVLDAVQAMGYPSYALLLPPAEMLPCCSRLVRHALRCIVVKTHSAPPSADGAGDRGWPAAVAMALTSLMVPLARLCLLVQHALALATRTSFFEIAELFTNRRRKVQRLVNRWRTCVEAVLARQPLPSATRERDARLAWLEDAVNARQKQQQDGSGHSSKLPPRDLLDALVAPPTQLSTKELVDVLSDVLTAGGDTTAATLSTAALLLQRQPACAAKVAAEAAAIFGDAAATDAGDRDERSAMARAVAKPASLAYTRAVLSETTRLYPAAPLLLRVALEDTRLGEAIVPKGSGLVASTRQLGRHVASWGEHADDFVPERFLPGDPLHRSSDAAKAYMAFGAGPRACIGQQLALTVGALLLASMVHDASEEGLL